MKVIFLRTGETENYNESYGTRLIEQGKAVLAPIPQRKPEVKTEDQEPPAKPKAKRNGKAE